MNYTAIDFETAQGKRNSICQVGLVRVENQKVIEKLSILVRPPDNYYFYHNTKIHGLTSINTQNSPNFDVVWKQIEPFIKNQHVVAHNGFGFDFPVLNVTLAHYGIHTPEYEKHCTLKIFKKKLNLLCQEYRIPLNHHDALSDAMACAKLFHLYLRDLK